MMNGQAHILTTTSTSINTSQEIQNVQVLDSDLYVGMGIDGFFLLLITLMVSIFELIK